VNSQSLDAMAERVAELVGCPFCNKKPHLTVDRDDRNIGVPYPGGFLIIECLNDECYTEVCISKKAEFVNYSTVLDGMIKMWNNRPEIDTPQQAE